MNKDMFTIKQYGLAKKTKTGDLNWLNRKTIHKYIKFLKPKPIVNMYAYSLWIAVLHFTGFFWNLSPANGKVQLYNQQLWCEKKWFQ